ncbi:MAG: glycosyltransferase [Sarcina sp.]
MKTIVFFTWVHVSHIKPIYNFMKFISKDNKYNLIIFGVERNKELIKSIGAKFIAYPNKCIYHKKTSEEIDLENKLNKTQSATECYKILTKKGIYRTYEDTSVCYDELFNKTKELNPDLIIRDACCLFAKYIGQDLRVETRGYITSNLYTRSYIMNTLYQNLDEKDFLQEIEILSQKWHEEISKKYTLGILPYNYTLNPYEKINYIFSFPSLQPQLCEDKEKYIFIPPTIEPIREERLSVELESFLSTSVPIIYFSTGSFLTAAQSIYNNIIKFFESNKNYKVVIAIPKYNKNLWNELNELNTKENILILLNAPQQIILKQASIFISSCGFNSICEAIQNEVPMLTIPLANEQFFNAKILRELNIGDGSLNQFEFTPEYLDIMIDKILNNRNMKKNIKKIKNENIKFLEKFKLSDTLDF